MKHLRRWEIGELLSWFPSGSRIVEVGAGTGAQAAMLAALGFEVTALEVESDDGIWTEYQDNQEFPLTMYDGTALPFEDGSFDLVYSSNVLEHVGDVQGLLAECDRVLAPGGRMVMVVPSAAWRAVSILAYYPARVLEMTSLVKTKGDGVSLLPERRRVTVSSFFPVDARGEGQCGHGVGLLLPVALATGVRTCRLTCGG